MSLVQITCMNYNCNCALVFSNFLYICEWQWGFFDPIFQWKNEGKKLKESIWWHFNHLDWIGSLKSYLFYCWQMLLCYRSVQGSGWIYHFSDKWALTSNFIKLHGMITQVQKRSILSKVKTGIEFLNHLAWQKEMHNKLNVKIHTHLVIWTEWHFLRMLRSAHSRPIILFPLTNTLNGNLVMPLLLFWFMSGI